MAFPFALLFLPELLAFALLIDLPPFSFTVSFPAFFFSFVRWSFDPPKVLPPNAVFLLDDSSSRPLPLPFKLCSSLSWFNLPAFPFPALLFVVVVVDAES